MRSTSLALLVVLTSFVAPVSTQSPKAPWRWTLDERLAGRDNAVAATARLLDARMRESSLLAKTASTSKQPTLDDFDFISGKTHPELFVPWELFDHMMEMAYADDPEVGSNFREARRSSLASSGLPADFWNKLEAISVAYLSDRRQTRDLHKRAVSDSALKNRIRIQTASLETLKCRDRAAAIAPAHQNFGEKFDRFLYEGIAPTMTITVGRSGRISPTREHEIEDGCQ
jgi:hypothetical protein